MCEIKFFGLVVLYYPEPSLFDNIRTYIDSLDLLMVWDNTPSKDSKYDQVFFSLISDKIIYQTVGENIGISGSFNHGLIWALDNKADWLFTIDQDSYIEMNMLDIYKDFIFKTNIDKIAILSAKTVFSDLKIDDTEYYEFNNYRIVERLCVMASGNLINLKLIEKIGKFDEKLFIDYVDHEFCLRINSLGYKVIEIYEAMLNHKLGDFKQSKGLFKFYTTNHNYIRRYYITRNRFYVMFKFKNQYPGYFKFELNYFFKEIFKIIFGESDKIRKLYSIFKGSIDFIFKNYPILK